MIQLHQNNLSVHILHPKDDIQYFGSRYCTGGYIHQIDYGAYGSLLSGPAYPDPTPPPFDGQGAPEVFVKPLGDENVAPGKTVTVIGVGEVLRSSANVPFHPRQNPKVNKYCKWEIEQSSGSVTMNTRQHREAYHITLSRTVTLKENSVKSISRLSNDSEISLEIVWFPHPFFPLNPSLECCRFKFDYDLPDNPAYVTAADRTLCMKPDYNWKKGLFLKTTISEGSMFRAEVMHPKCKTVVVTGDYPLSALPFWANANTFSPEAYMKREIAAGETVEWSICYEFRT